MPPLLQAIRGMNDILPEQTIAWQYLESIIEQVVAGYGYAELRLPIVEKTALFKRSIGEVTDIVEKEMYTFADRNDESMTLRPEGTAGCVRAVLQHGMLNQIQRLWYGGPMFRYERPQKGRYRQFHQIGVEAYGLADPDIDVELILMSARIWQMLGLHDVVTLQINSLGTSASRLAYRQALIDYLSNYKELLDADSQRRLNSNPLRILDSKNPDVQALLKSAPVLSDYYDDASQQHFDTVIETLGQLGVSYQVNHRLVRGLDYYCHTVFEWVTDELGAQGTICAGGRYDSLVELLGGKPTPAIGFAIGIERAVLLLTNLNLVPAEMRQIIDIYLVAVGEQVQLAGFLFAERLRDAIPGLRLRVNCGGGSFKSQMKKADKSGAKYAIIFGEDEVENSEATLKYLRDDQPQQRYCEQEMINYLANELGVN